MYADINDLRRILPEKVTIGDQNIGTPSPGRTATKRSTISPEEAIYYIRYAQEQIDAKLRTFYSCPLRRTITFETPLESIVNAGTDVSVTVHDSGSFAVGQTVRLRNSTVAEETEISSVTNATTLVLSTVVNSYTSGDLAILEYPDPIPLTTARMACSYIIDRLFTAEQSPDVSTYGKTQRDLATLSLDSIQLGQILLFGQELTGYRFVRGNVFSAYKSPAQPIQKGEDKE